jgi:hypothetical protein
MAQKNLKKRFLFLFVALCVVLIIAEIFAQTLYPKPQNLLFTQLGEELKKSKRFDAISKAFENDNTLFWRFKNNVTLPETETSYRGIISNDQGLREDQHITGKAGNEFRVLFLGDSCTFGYGLLLKEGFVDLCEKRLQDEYPLKKIQCINAGVPGYSIFQGRQSMKRHLLTLKPDMLVVNFGWNDQNDWGGKSDKQQFQAIERSQPPGFLASSRLCQLLWAPGKDLVIPKKRPRVTPHEFFEDLNGILKSCKKQQIKMAVLVWPSRHNIDANRPALTRSDWQIMQYAFHEKNSKGSDSVLLFDMVPLVQSLFRTNDVDEIFLDDVHTTALCNKIIAQKISQQISGFLDKD